MPGGQSEAITTPERVRLADAVRHLIDAVLTADDASPEELDAAADAAERIAASLHPRGELGDRPEGVRSRPEETHEDYLPRSPLVGRISPIAPPIEYEFLDGGVRAGGVFHAAFEGPPGYVHGGWIALAFDEILGMTNMASGNPGMTGRLSIRYRRPTPLHTKVAFRGWVEQVDGRRVVTRGTLSVDDVVTAEAEGLFVMLSPELALEYFGPEMAERRKQLEDPLPNFSGMALPEHGRSKDELLAELEAMRAHDVDWRSGRCFSYVFSAGDEVRDVARAATTMYLSENALNTAAFPSLGRLQAEVVDAVSGFAHGGPDAAGFMTSGGTESILCIVKAARERAKRERGITEPEMVLAESAHAAFHKGAHYFGVRAVTVPVGADFRADVDAMAAAVTDRTALVVGSAPQYPQGVIDPIPDLAALAAGVGANFHTDACMGGMVLPFLEQLGDPVPPWDFRVDGVTSISIDLHKLGYTPKGASVVLHRTKALRRDQTFAFDGWLGGMYASSGMAGTKPGGPIAAAWAVLNFLGEEGYRRLTRATVDAARRIVAGARAVDGLRVLGDPDAHVLAMAADGDSLDVFALGDALRERGWFLDRQGPPDSLHATVSAGNAPVIDELLADLETCAAIARDSRAADRGTDYATLE